MRVQQLTEDDLNKRSAKHTNKSTLVATGADTQLGSICVPATNVDLWSPLNSECSQTLALVVAVCTGTHPTICNARR